MSYKIECVVQELEFKDGKIASLKVKGTEGFLLKLGDEEYNVFCPEKMPGECDSCADVKIANVKKGLELKTAVEGFQAEMLVKVKMQDKKVRLKFDVDSGTCVPCLNGNLISVSLL